MHFPEVKPLAIDLFCGLGGWTEGLLAEGYYVVGFDIERHEYGEAKYPAQLVLQDVLTLHGKQFKDAALIVASPPCQEFSYMAMPWSLAKAKRAKILADPVERKRLTALFDACFRIQREGCEAAGRHIPLVVENVRGAQEWVGRSRWNFGSFHLWGDVPALMPMTRAVKVPTMGAGWYPPDHPKHVPGLAFNTHAERLTRRTDPETACASRRGIAGSRMASSKAAIGSTPRSHQFQGGVAARATPAKRPPPRSPRSRSRWLATSPQFSSRSNLRRRSHEQANARKPGRKCGHPIAWTLPRCAPSTSSTWTAPLR